MLAREHPQGRLGHIADVLLSLTYNREANDRADVDGWVVGKRDLGKSVFVDLSDGTGKIQLLFRRDIQEDVWRVAGRLHVGDRVNATGEIGISKTGAFTIFCDHLAVTFPAEVDRRHPQRVDQMRARLPDEMRRLLTMARLRRSLGDFLRNNNYDEIDPPLLDSGAPSMSTRPPLRLLVGGLGAGRPLSVSPAPLLLSAVLAGVHNVFSISRAFCSNLVAGDDGSDCLILCARKATPTAGEMNLLGQTLIRHFLDTWGGPGKFGAYAQGDWKVVERPIAHFVSTSITNIEYQEPTVILSSGGQIPHQDSSTHYVKDLFWICWPPSLILGAGNTEIVDGGFMVGLLTLYLDAIHRLVDSEHGHP